MEEEEWNNNAKIYGSKGKEYIGFKASKFFEKVDLLVGFKKATNLDAISSTRIQAIYQTVSYYTFYRKFADKLFEDFLVNIN